MCAFNDVGTYVPPMIVFPRIRMVERFMVGAPSLTLGCASKSGWMDTNLFVRWMEHFIDTVKPSPKEPHLLLLDGHMSHKSFAVMDLARKNGVIMLNFPPNATHKIQPLDRVLYGPLKTYYNQECEKWMDASSCWNANL